MSEPKSKRFIIPVKGVYLLQHDENSDTVERKYSEIVWFHQHLRREFPGLRINPVPENELGSIREFFESVLKYDVISNSYLFNFFCFSKDEVKIREFVKMKNSLYPEVLGIDKIKSFFTGNSVVRQSELDSLREKAKGLPEIVRSMSADYSRFSDNVFETSEIISMSLTRANKSLEEIQSLYVKIVEKFQEVSQNFSGIIALVNRLNFAKTQFSAFDESQIHLDIILLKLKNSFDDSGSVTSENHRTKGADY